MSYQIVRTDGGYVATVLDDAVNTAALPINLFGRGLTNYGEGLNENFVFMLENFAGPRAPQRATPGMLWFDAGTQVLRVLNSAQEWHGLAYTDAGDQSFNGSLTVRDGLGDGATLGNGGILTLVRAVTDDGPEIDLKRAWSAPATGQIKLVSGLIDGAAAEFVQIKDNLLVTGFARIAGNAEVDGDLNVLGRLQHHGFDVVTTEVFNQADYVTREEINTDDFWRHTDFNINDYLLISNFHPEQFLRVADFDASAYVKSNGSTMSGDLVIANTPDGQALRLVQGGYGLIQCMDNTNFSIQLTNANDPLGHATTAARPLIINLADGHVTMNNLFVSGNGNVWTSANFNPASYLSLAGGTLSGSLVAQGGFIQCMHANTPIVFAHKPGVAAGGVCITDDNRISLVQCDGGGGVYKQLVSYSTELGHLRFNAPIEDAIGYGNQLHLVDGGDSITVMLRNDGQHMWFLTSDRGNPNGNYNGLRPLYFDLSTGDVATNHNLNVGGTITAGGDVVAFSDARVKQNVTTIDGALALVGQMRGVRFTRKADGTSGVGVIAQEMQGVLPAVVHQTEDGTLGVAYGNLTGVLIEAVKELAAQNAALKARLDALDAGDMIGG